MIDIEDSDDCRVARDMLSLLRSLVATDAAWHLWSKFDDLVDSFRSDEYNGCPCCNRDSWYDDDSEEDQ